MVGQKFNSSHKSGEQNLSNFADLRTDKEKCIEKKVYNGLNLEPGVSALIDELVEIGKTCGFISTPGGNFNGNGHHIRTREIGMQLDNMGGMELMQVAYYTVARVLGPVAGRSLEVAWGYIGNWWP
ncbi:MAG: hypothetical protein PVF58_05985 [Candidatus Methanofastidiosia archaeon]|jgi:hypothetical protein